MEDDDFLLDEDENLEDNYDIVPEEEEEEDSDENSEIDEEGNKGPNLTEDDYQGKMTKDEIFLCSAYNDITTSAKKNEDRVSVGGGNMFDGCIIDAVRTILSSIPKNTSSSTIEHNMQDIFNTQGHNRIPSSVYTPDKPLRSSELDEEFGGSDDDGFNVEYAKEARNQISRFISFLAERDLSKDSIISKRRKQRQLPAFIIFLFSSGMYDLILNCDTMPKEYAKQIENAFKEIQGEKYKIVEALADKYESCGRKKVADKVREMGVSWFKKEPAEILTTKAYNDLELTYDDVLIYREFRPRFTNASKSITQDLISDYIKVVIKPGSMYEKLKDKTRSDAISDVKQVYKDWSKENPIDSELADKVIWNNL